MYDELLTRLREDMPTALANCDFDFVEGWSKEAADAIEELKKKVDEWQETACNWNNEYYHLLDNTPRWIPVTERLPPRTNVLVWYHGKVCMAYLTDYTSDGSLCWVEGYGNYVRVSDNSIKYWMPLPEPPKEET